MATRRITAWLILAAFIGLTSGCRTPDANPSSLNQEPTIQPAKDERGLLLQTGAIQLGPGTGKNLWGWQGDGHSGF
jgi:hypothetical protein